MAAQKCKKKQTVDRNFFAFLNVYYPKTHLIKALNSLDLSRPNGRLLEDLKTGASRNLFLPEIISKLALQLIFQKKHPDFVGLEMNKDMKLRREFFFHMFFYR